MKSRQVSKPARRRRLPLAIAAAAAVAAIVAIVAWPTPGNDGGVGTREPAAGDRAEALAAGQRLVRRVDERVPAPLLRVQTASFGNGSVFDLAEQRGSVVVLYFTAAWCPTCTAETQALARIQEAHAAHGVRILALDVDWTETEDDLEAYRAKYGNGRHFWAMDEDLAVAQAYGIRSLGSTVFIDREGRIAYSDSLQTPYETLDAIIEALLL